MKKILVIDDDAMSVEFLSMYLSSKGYQVLKAGTVEEALRLLDQHSPEAVITDIQLSDGSGLDIAIYAKKRANSVVIGVTGYDRHSLEASGADISSLSTLLSKPLDLSGLDTALNGL